MDHAAMCCPLQTKSASLGNRSGWLSLKYLIMLPVIMLPVLRLRRKRSGRFRHSYEGGLGVSSSSRWGPWLPLETGVLRALCH